MAFGSKHSLGVKKILTWNKEGFIPKLQCARVANVFSDVTSPVNKNGEQLLSRRVPI